MLSVLAAFVNRTKLRRVTDNCWSVRIPDDHRLKPTKLRELMPLEPEPGDDFGVVHIGQANRL